MRKLLLGVLLIPALLSAEPVQVEKKVACDKFDNVINALGKNHGEFPIWVSTGKESQVAVLVNPKSTSWSVIQYNAKVACVLETGEGFKYLPEALSKKPSTGI